LTGEDIEKNQISWEDEQNAKHKEWVWNYSS
jgi:hypothetical protein